MLSPIPHCVPGGFLTNFLGSVPTGLRQQFFLFGGRPGLNASMDFWMRSCYPQTAREDFSNWMGGGAYPIQPMWAYPMMNIDKPSPRIFHALFKCLNSQPQLLSWRFISLDLPLSWEIQEKPLSWGTRYTTVDEVQYHEDCTLRGAPGTEARDNSGDQGGSGPTGATKVEHVRRFPETGVQVYKYFIF